MEAVVFNGTNEEVTTVPEPVLGPGEVLVDVAYCGICGSDLHAASGDFHDGTVMGHEFSGTVAEVADDVADWAVGDRIVVNPNGAWCGACDQCVRGAFNMCPHVWEGAVGLAQNGGLAAHTVVAARMLRRIPDTLDLRRAALTEPLAVSLRTVRRSEIAIGDTAVVFGGGPIGLLVTALLRAAGASRITVVEPSAGRRAVAMTMGATATIDPTVTDPTTAFIDGERPLFGYDCTGVQSIPGVALRTIAPHGRLTITGFSRKPPTFDAAELLFSERDIRGSFIYVEEFEQAIDLLASGVVDVDPLISDVVEIEDADRAFDAMRHSPDAFKYLITSRLSDSDR